MNPIQEQSTYTHLPPSPELSSIQTQELRSMMENQTASNNQYAQFLVFRYGRSTRHLELNPVVDRV